MSFFISNAYANTAAPAPADGMISMVVMLAVFGLIFYFMIIRPQSKRAKAHRDLMNSISTGDEVLTNGGLLGKVTKVNNETGYIVIALNENNEVMIKRDFVAAVLPKGTMKELR